MPAAAQAWPSKPVQLIVPQGAGGSTDALARLLAPLLGERLGQTEVIDNRAGAGGVLGVSTLAKAPADGCTLLFGSSTTVAANAFLYASFPIDPLKDLVPPALADDAPFVIVVPRSSASKSLRELVATAKASPGKLNYGFGTSSGLLCMELLKSAAGIDIAKVPYKVPVYQLLGGKFRDKIRVYCDTGAYRTSGPTPDDFAKAAKNAAKMGFTAVKFDIDERNDPNKFDSYNWTASNGELERMYNQIAAVREAVGPKVDICVDMHGRYDTTTGKRVAKMMEPLKLLFLEEPFPADNPEAYKIVRDSTQTPICAGENHYLAHGFRKLLELGAVDIVMPDLQKAGGLGEGQRIANLSNLYYVPFAPHMVASYLGAMAASHVCATVPNFLILEWQIYFHEDPMLWYD